MIKGLYTSARGMTPQSTKLEIAANNIANAVSTGFKKTKIFDGILTKEINSPLEAGAGSIKDNFRTSIDFSQGDMHETKNPLDVALMGNGFFMLETPDGLRYTRNGNFTLGPNGELMTNNGFLVQGEQGTISIPEPEKVDLSSIMINDKGEVYLGDRKIDQIRTVTFNDLEKLQSENNSTFSAPEGISPEEVTVPSVLVRQGYLEGSNVDIIREMILMIDAKQTFETSQKIIRTQESTLDQANEIGKV